MKKRDLLISQFPEPFNFYRLILKGEHLHFGFWPGDSPNLTLEEAREGMFNRLLEYFPEPPASILDVGCGLGFSAYCLSQKGYDVTAIAPSRELIDYASAKYGRGEIDFQVAGFLDENEHVFTSREYDVVFFQEFLQYLHPLDSVFKKARSLLKPKGVVIIGDEVCQDHLIAKETAVHLLKDVVVALLENGFRIKVNKPAAKHVSKTYDIVIQQFQENFERIVSSVNTNDAADKLGYFLNDWNLKRKWHENGVIGYNFFVAKRDKVFMRTYEHGDEENILPMFNTVFDTNRTMDHWYWKFRDNPFGRYNIAVATTEDGVLAAHYCGYPVPFHSSVGNQKEFMSFQIGDTMTNPGFRTLGLGTTSVLSQVTKYFYHRFCRDVVPLNYGFNTGNIRKFGKRFLGYVYTSHVRYYVMDLNEKKLEALPRLKRFLLGFTFEKVSRCSREYDLFFDRVCNGYGMLAKRTASYLQWRYLDCPDKIHNVFAVRRFRKLVGWSVFSRKDDVLEWGDALFDKKYLYIIGSMLAYLRRQFFPEISQIRGWFSPAPEWWGSALRDAGFKITGEPNNFAPGFRIFDDDFSRELLEHHFYYSMGDSDLF